MAGDWRKLHCVELHDLFFLPNTILVIIMKNEMVGVCSTHRGEERCMHRFGGKTREEIPLARPRGVWEGNTGMDIRIVWEGNTGMDIRSVWEGNTGMDIRSV